MESDSRTRILDVALDLFDRLGYVGTSMDAIRKAAGFRTKSSLYTHFASKESLTVTLLERILTEETVALAPYLKSSHHATLDDVLKLAEQLTLWGLLHPAAYRFCFLRWHEVVPILPVKDSVVGYAPDWAREVICRIQQEGGPVRAMTPEFLVTACNGLINQVIIESERNVTPDSISKIARQTRDLCYAILCP